MLKHWTISVRLPCWLCLMHYLGILSVLCHFVPSLNSRSRLQEQFISRLLLPSYASLWRYAASWLDCSIQSVHWASSGQPRSESAAFCPDPAWKVCCFQCAEKDWQTSRAEDLWEGLSRRWIEQLQRFGSGVSEARYVLSPFYISELSLSYRRAMLVSMCNKNVLSFHTANVLSFPSHQQATPSVIQSKPWNTCDGPARVTTLPPATTSPLCSKKATPVWNRIRNCLRSSKCERKNWWS